MRSNEELLLNLLEKYKDPFSLIQRLEEKYPAIAGDISMGDKKPVYIVLKDDKQSNTNYVKELIERANELGSALNVAEKDINAKIIDNFKLQLGRITDSKFDSGEKTADSVCKCVKNTIIKLINHKDFKDTIIDYLRQSGFDIISFEPGYKLRDDDFYYMDDNLFSIYKQKTDNKDDHYRVIEMVQPIVSLSYISEDEEKQEHWIPGVCKYYVMEA